jgi:hypothetical protein
MAALAFANGSNDVSKGIATLAGSGVTNYRRAILWGNDVDGTWRNTGRVHFKRHDQDLQHSPIVAIAVMTEPLPFLLPPFLSCGFFRPENPFHAVRVRLAWR